MGNNTPGSAIEDHVRDAPPADGGKTDKAVDQLRDFFTLMRHQNLGFLYERWRKHACADPSRVAQWQSVEPLGQKDIDNANKLRGLDIGKLKELSGRLDGVGKAATELSKSSQSMGGDLDHNWNSQSSGKAVDKFTDLKSASTDCHNQAQTLSTHVNAVHTAAANVSKQLNNFWDGVCKKGSGVIDQQGGLGNGGEDAGEARGELSGHLDGIDQALRFGLYREGTALNWHPNDGSKNNMPKDKLLPPSPGLAHRIRSETSFLDLGGSGPFSGTYWANDVCHKLDKMAGDYCAAMKKFRNVVSGAYNNIDRALSHLNTGIEQVDTDPFKNLVAPGETPPQDHKPEKNTGDGGNHQPPQHDSGGQTSAASTGGDQSQRSSGGTTGPASTGSQPPPGSGGDMGGPGGNTGPGTTGGRPQAPGQDGMQMPGKRNIEMPGRHGGRPQAPGQDGMQMPGDRNVEMPGQHGGQPQAPGQPGGRPETMKIHTPNGSDIELTSPDGQGHMKLTVDDGSGKPKSYDIDFGDQAGQQGAPAQSPGADAQAGAQGAAGQPGSDGGQSSAGAAGGADAGQAGPGGQPDAGSGADGGTAGQPGTGGADGGTGDQPGAQQVHADQSGHAVIHDGDSTITVDKAPDSDQVKLTVDDGSGEPATYTVDGTGNTSPAAVGDRLSGGAGDGGPGVAAGLGGGLDAGVGAGTGHGDQLQGAMSGGDQNAGGSPAPGQHAGPGVAGGVGGGGFDGPGIAADPGGAAGPDLGDAAGPDPGGATDPGLGGGHGAPAATPHPGQQSQMEPGAMSGADPNMNGGAGAGGMAQAGAHGGPGAASGAGGGHGGGGGGMIPPMMGGMGGGGAGGDSERGTSSWRTEGNLFDDDAGAAVDEIEELLGGAQYDPWR